MKTKSYGPIGSAQLPDAALDPPDDYWGDDDEEYEEDEYEEQAE